eukprot:COSAG04_NODE_25468_length_307_cov_0.735577_1_plen_44_part_01
MLRHRAAVAANRGSALNTVADQLEDIDGAIEETWNPVRKRKLEK